MPSWRRVRLSDDGYTRWCDRGLGEFAVTLMSQDEA